MENKKEDYLIFFLYFFIVCNKYIPVIDPNVSIVISSIWQLLPETNNWCISSLIAYIIHIIIATFIFLLYDFVILYTNIPNIKYTYNYVYNKIGLITRFDRIKG